MHNDSVAMETLKITAYYKTDTTAFQAFVGWKRIHLDWSSGDTKTMRRKNAKNSVFSNSALIERERTESGLPEQSIRMLLSVMCWIHLMDQSHIPLLQIMFFIHLQSWLQISPYSSTSSTQVHVRIWFGGCFPDVSFLQPAHLQSVWAEAITHPQVSALLLHM